MSFFSSVTGYALINTATDLPIDGMSFGADFTVSLSSLPSGVTIQAFIDQGTVSSVDFYRNSNFERTESIFPYCINGDDLGDFDNFAPFNSAGVHVIRAEPFWEGVAGAPLEITLTITND